jgi:N-sulfoglucosamine sulfohydrolase
MNIQTGLCRRMLSVCLVLLLSGAVLSAQPPNILLVISDDQSYPHAGAYGDTSVHTPAFDRIAKEGVLFTHGFCPASQCSPSRAALLTGRNIWQLEEAGTHASTFPAKFVVYPDLLKAEGYHIGYTGKPWAPGSWKDGGRTSNPAGPEYNERKLVPPSKFISSVDYAENFKDFLSDRPEGAPFHFWFGAHEPHRDYDPDSGISAGKQLDAVDVPGYWPDNEIIRRDFLDYKFEIDWFDKQLAKIIAILEENGELENTLILVTSDNGMPFPKAKANLYEAGIRVPLAIRWGDKIPRGRVVDDLVSFIDLAPTILEAAGIKPIPDITGRSVLPLLLSKTSGIVEPDRSFVLLGKERHNYARPDNVGYPVRAIRTQDFLYIRNMKPERWPLGDPPYYWCHTKMTNPTKDFILKNSTNAEYRFYYDVVYNKRPAEELYQVNTDFDCIHNLAKDKNFDSIRQELSNRLNQLLLEQKDPRVLGYGDIFESYPYYQKLPEEGFPGFMEYGKYNPKFAIEK